MSRHASASEDLKRLPAKARQAAREALHDVEGRVSKEYQNFKVTAAKEIRNRPLGYVLGAFGTGLFLGRFKVRPVETVLLACVTGLFLGFTYAQGSGASQRSNC